MNRQNHEIYNDSNKMAIEYARDAIRFAFFLNGAAATALFAKTQVSFVFPAAIFAVSAAFAVFCMGISYLVQLALSETWKQEGPLYVFNLGPKIFRLTIAQIEIGRLVAIFFWIASMVLFFFGAHGAWQAAKSLSTVV